MWNDNCLKGTCEPISEHLHANNTRMPIPRNEAMSKFEVLEHAA